MPDTDGQTFYLLSDANKSKIKMLLYDNGKVWLTGRESHGTCGRHVPSPHTGRNGGTCALREPEVLGEKRRAREGWRTTDTSLKHAKLRFQWFVKIQILSAHLRLQSIICFLLFLFWVLVFSGFGNTSMNALHFYFSSIIPQVLDPLTIF